LCDCVKLSNEELAKHNTRLELAFTMTGVMPNVLISTEKVDTKKRAGPIRLFAAFCPFCGEEYKPREVMQNTGR
jgi:hypothetical protein